MSGSAGCIPDRPTQSTSSSLTGSTSRMSTWIGCSSHSPPTVAGGASAGTRKSEWCGPCDARYSSPSYSTMSPASISGASARISRVRSDAHQEHVNPDPISSRLRPHRGHSKQSKQYDMLGESIVTPLSHPCPLHSIFIGCFTLMPCRGNDPRCAAARVQSPVPGSCSSDTVYRRRTVSPPNIAPIDPPH